MGAKPQEVHALTVVAATLTLHPEHNLIRFWAWGEEECALPAGATGATLRDERVNGDELGDGDESGDGDDDDFGGRRLRLAPGDVLFAEGCGICNGVQAAHEMFASLERLKSRLKPHTLARPSRWRKVLQFRSRPRFE